LRGEFVWDDLLLVKQNQLASGEFKSALNLVSRGFSVEHHRILGARAGLENKSARLSCGEPGTARTQRPARLACAEAPGHRRCVVRGGDLRGASSVRGVRGVDFRTENTLSLAFFLAGLAGYLRFEENSGNEAASKITGGMARARRVPARASEQNFHRHAARGFCCFARGGGGDKLRAATSGAPRRSFALAAGVRADDDLVSKRIKSSSARPVQPEDFSGRLAGAGRALWFYLGKALWPVHLNLIYPRWEMDAHAGRAFLPAFFWCLLLGVVGDAGMAGAVTHFWRSCVSP